MEDDNVIDWSQYGKGNYPKEVLEKIHYVELDDGTSYADVLDYQLTASWIAISMKDGTVHFHNTNTIKHIKSYFKENTQ